MNTVFYLLNLEMRGIKNIEKPIKIEFYKKTISNDFDPTYYRVKGIYGENGSGKTALITAVSIFRNLIINKNYLSDYNTQKKLIELINKKTKAANIAVEFYSNIIGYQKIYRYEVMLSVGEDDQINITIEKFFDKEGKYSKNKFNSIFTVENGRLSSLRIDKQSALETVTEKTLNLLSRQTFVTAVLDWLNKIPEEEKKEYRALLGIGVPMLIMFAMILYTYLDDSDYHSDYYFREKIKDLSSGDLKGVDVAIDLLRDYAFSLRSNEQNVHKKVYRQYENKIARLCEFLKIFKPDLQNIEIEKHEDRDFYLCKLIMVYEDYRLDIEFESRGIKKLAGLFDYLDSASRGAIVFIDELDSNINDVYLDKIIEYMMYYGEGQLCFTAHNLSPMNVLKQNKASITFISSINTIHTWTNSGNLKPENAYRNGFIEDSPFNVQASDFLGILGGDDE